MERTSPSRYGASTRCDRAARGPHPAWPVGRESAEKHRTIAPGRRAGVPERTGPKGNQNARRYVRSDSPQNEEPRVSLGPSNLAPEAALSPDRRRAQPSSSSTRPQAKGNDSKNPRRAGSASASARSVSTCKRRDPRWAPTAPRYAGTGRPRITLDGARLAHRNSADLCLQASAEPQPRQDAMA